MEDGRVGFGAFSCPVSPGSDWFFLLLQCVVFSSLFFLALADTELDTLLVLVTD